MYITLSNRGKFRIQKLVFQLKKKYINISDTYLILLYC